MLSAGSFAQKSTIPFINKKNQHHISAEFASVSYTYIHQFAPKLQLGARLQAGMAFYFIPSLPPQLDPEIFDLINFQILYRTKAARSFYFDLGTVISYLSFLEGMEDQQDITFGLSGAAYYNYKKFHIGFSLQLRFIENEYYYYSSNNTEIWESELKSLVLFSPLILGFSF